MEQEGVRTEEDDFPVSLNIPEMEEEEDDEDEEETNDNSSVVENRELLSHDNEQPQIDRDNQTTIIQNINNPPSSKCSIFFYLILYIIYFLGVCVGTLIILPMARGKECDQPLVLFIEVQMGILTCVLLLKVWTTINDYRGILTNPIQFSICMRFQSRLALFFQRVTNMLWCVWFLIGTVWTFKSQTCAQTSHALYIFSISIVIINLAIIGFCTVCCFCGFICLGFCYMINPNVFREDRNRGAPKKDIEKLETKIFTKGMIEDENDAKCVICLNNYEEGDELRYLPCKPKNHHYHRECIDEWLVLNKTCPFCKRAIDEVDSDTDNDNQNENTTSNNN